MILAYTGDERAKTLVCTGNAIRAMGGNLSLFYIHISGNGKDFGEHKILSTLLGDQFRIIELDMLLGICEDGDEEGVYNSVEKIISSQDVDMLILDGLTVQHCNHLFGTNWEFTDRFYNNPKQHLILSLDAVPPTFREHVNYWTWMTRGPIGNACKCAPVLGVDF